VKEQHCGQENPVGLENPVGRSGQNRGRHGQKVILSTQSTTSISSTKGLLSTKSSYPEIAANAALTLLAVACALLDRQLAAQAKAFETEGGFTERLYKIRIQKRSTQSTKSTPSTKK
jgi:four helix bundle suffix protein